MFNSHKLMICVCTFWEPYEMVRNSNAIKLKHRDSIFPNFLQRSKSAREGWGWEGNKEGMKKMSLHLILILMAPSRPRTEFFAFYSTSASCTMASKMPDSHISTLDHSFLSFQLFLTPYSILFFFNFTETSST